jgi:predicted lipoprotein with Yx(FWY)xxD motif
MRSPSTIRRRLLAALAVATLAVPAFAAGAPVLAAPGDPSASCAEPTTAVPTGPATVSVAKSAFGRILVEGAGPYRGCSLYLLTSDELHAAHGAPYACSDGDNEIGLPCDTVLWPALLTSGQPIAGPGVNRRLLGTVTRTDLPGLPAVQQVTYAGYPLYRFFLDEEPGETDGASLFDPITSPTGIWYLVEPHRGAPAPGRARLELETAPVAGGADATVLAVSMDHGFVLLPDGDFPVYSLSTDRGHGPGRRASACSGDCPALYWPPVLTSGRPIAGPGVDQHALGTIRRADGSQQVTYRGKPLYLFYGDAYIPPFTYNGGVAGINGAGRSTPWGVFDTVPPQS